MTSRAIRMAAALALVACTGCAMGPDYERPDTSELESFRATTSGGESLADVNWWELYQDPVLRGLIGRALENNRDARSAMLAITEAELQAGNVRTQFFPELTVGGEMSGTFAASTGAGYAPQANANLAVNMRYELDIWGRIRRSNEAALAEVLSSQEAYHSLLLTLIASVASGYFTLLDLDNRIAITERTIEERTQGLTTVESRYRGGLTTELDVRQAQIQLYAAQVSLATFQRLQAQTENALSVLIGETPASIPRGRPLFDQVLPPAVPIGLASDLVSRRPDIQQAGHRLHAQTARIGIAEANRFPTFALTGPAGVTSILTNPNITTGFITMGLSMLSPLFNAGRLKREVQIEVVRTESLALQYEQTILVAFAEVEDALIAHQTLQDELEANTAEVEAAQAAYVIVSSQYRAGLTSYLQVVNIENSLFSAQLSLSQARQAFLVAVVNLYKALGGGWSPEETVDEASAAAQP